ncbi:hypothetical protein ACFX11_031878 [Malus domestica]
MVVGRSMARKLSQEVWVGILVSFYILCISLFCLRYSTSLGANNVINLLVNKQVHPTCTTNINHTNRDSCLNRYIYIHDGLPARFNYDFLNNGESLSPGRFE